MRGVGDREAIGGEHGLGQSGAAAVSASHGQGYREAELCRPAAQRGERRIGIRFRGSKAPDY